MASAATGGPGGKREKGEKGTFGIFSSRLDTLGGVADHAGDKSTSSFRPSAAAPLWSVTSLGLSIFPVSNRDRAGASMPIRPAGADSWLSHKALVMAKLPVREQRPG